MFAVQMLKQGSDKKNYIPFSSAGVHCRSLSERELCCRGSPEDFQTNPFLCWRKPESPSAWWSLRVGSLWHLSQKLTGLFFTSTLKHLHSIPEAEPRVGLVKIRMRASEPQISINAKLLGLQNLKSARLQAQGCNGSLPGNCVPAVQSVEVFSFGLVGWLLQPTPIKMIAPWALRMGDVVTLPAGRSDQKFPK